MSLALVSGPKIRTEYLYFVRRPHFLSLLEQHPEHNHPQDYSTWYVLPRFSAR